MSNAASKSARDDGDGPLSPKEDTTIRDVAIGLTVVAAAVIVGIIVVYCVRRWRQHASVRRLEQPLNPASA